MNLFPGWAAVRSWVLAAGGVACIVAGMVLGAWAKSWGEERRISRERTAAIVTANAKAEAEALRAAVQQQQATLELRRQALESSEAYIKQLEKEKEEARNASPNADAVVVPVGDPWLQPGRRR